MATQSDHQLYYLAALIGWKDCLGQTSAIDTKGNRTKVALPVYARTVLSKPAGGHADAKLIAFRWLLNNKMLQREFAVVHSWPSGLAIQSVPTVRQLA